jgi:hypothetical protein
MPLPARTAPVEDDAAEALARAHDAHDQALLAHARRGGSYDTRPVFVHPARQCSAAELADARQRLAAWHAFLATHPEARTLTRGTPHDAGGTAASQGAGGRTHDRYETRDAESSSDYSVLATPEDRS